MDIALCDGVREIFFLTLLFRKVKHDPCVKSVLHLGYFAAVQRRTVYLRTALLCPYFSSSHAMAVVFAPYSLVAKCIQDLLACIKMIFSPSQWYFPGDPIFLWARVFILKFLLLWLVLLLLLLAISFKDSSRVKDSDLLMNDEII